MKSSFDLKHNIAKITPENLDDVYLLEKIILPGTLVTAKTIRSKEIKRGDEKIKGKEESMTLTVLIEKTEFTEDFGLRAGGKIIAGPEDVEKGHHTIEVKPNTFLKIEKKWKQWEIDKINSASKKSEKILICILDETEADLWIVQERKKHLVHLTCSLGKKSGISTKPQYYAELTKQIEDKEADYVIVAGPAFAKEELTAFMKQKNIRKNITMDTTTQTGEAGLHELFNRGILEKVAKVSRLSEETQIVEKLLFEIAKEGLAVYGLSETKRALDIGAVEVLLISDKKVRENEELLEMAEKMKTRTMIISTEHQSCEKLYNLGGVAGLLRYKVG